MFDDILQSCASFQEHDIHDPFLETLRLFDLLSNGALRKMALSRLTQEPIDLNEIARKRKKGIPLEYILGRAIFMDLEFICSPETLIPRQETELLVRTALDIIRERRTGDRDLAVIDMGTGCGNIAISLAQNSSHTRLLASDISPGAVAIARENVARHGVQDRVSVFCGDLFEPFAGAEYYQQIDVVVCNPPYIPTTSLASLGPETMDHEPRIALDAGAYGLGLFRRLVTGSLDVLKPGGALVFEIGAGQEDLVTRLLRRKAAFVDLHHFRDGDEVRVISAAKVDARQAGRAEA